MQSLSLYCNNNSRSNFRKRRAVSDIIVTLLLVSITVIGGILAWTLVSGEGSIMGDAGSAITEPPKTSQGGIKIIAYDTRDGADLSGISGISNSATTDGFLKGEEFIVLTVVNNSPGPVVLNDFQINEVSHTYDSSGNLADGTFIVVSKDATDTSAPLAAELSNGVTAKVIIKLSKDDFNNSPIKLNKPIRVALDASGFNIQKFIINAGDIK